MHVKDKSDYGTHGILSGGFHLYDVCRHLWLLTRRNLLAMLISVELILNSVDINFAVFNRYLFPNELEGVFFALFAIGVSAAETAVAIAIIINIYRNIRNIQVKNLNEMKN